MIPIIGPDYPKIVIPMIDAARSSIDIVVYDWRWYLDIPGHPVQLFNQALVRAVKRGVRVRAVLNSDLIVPILKSVGIKAKCLPDRRTLHTKMMIIDERMLVIGSHNFSRNAFGSNIETSVAVEIPQGIDRFATFFSNIFGI